MLRSTASLEDLSVSGFKTPLEGSDDPEALVIVVQRNSPFLIEWGLGSVPKGAYSMRLENPAGQVVRLTRSSVRGIAAMDQCQIEGSSTPIHSAPEGSYEVVLSGDKGDLKRFSITLQGGDLQRISH